MTKTELIENFKKWFDIDDRKAKIGELTSKKRGELCGELEVLYVLYTQDITIKDVFDEANHAAYTLAKEEISYNNGVLMGWQYLFHCFMTNEVVK